jgi:hypothetical protein
VTITGTPVIDALETFYRRDIDDLANSARRTLDSAASRGTDVNNTLAMLRADDFLAVYLEQIHSVPPERWAESLPLPDPPSPVPAGRSRGVNWRSERSAPGS